MNEHGKIIGMFGGCHHCSDTLAGKIIVFFTSPPWHWKGKKTATHSSVGFIYDNGYREIYEAREGKSWQGPIPVTKVKRWVKRSPETRRFTMYDIPEFHIDAEKAASKKDRCEAMLKMWSYNMLQLPYIALGRFFIPITTFRSPNDVVCSEAASMILEPDVPVISLTGRRSVDLVTPRDFEKAMISITKQKGSK